jgi:2-haloacid dehalogenase
MIGMDTTRRDLLALAAGALATTAAAARPRAARRARIRAVAFDGFAIIDPRPIAARAEALFPGRAAELMTAWRTRQFEYTWLRTLGRRYVDFWQTSDEALAFAAASVKLELTPARRAQLMASYLELGAWPDAAAAVAALGRAGVRMAFLANLTSRMMDAALANGGLVSRFAPHLSTDRVKAFKPDPRAYQMAVDAFRLPREEILFVASAGWDAAGARWFGYPTVWVNRTAAPLEELGVAPDAVRADLRGLVELVG